MYHIFFIYSSADGQLGCFHILANVNYAAVNIGVHICFQISVLFFSDTYPGMELWDRMVVLFLVFLGTSILFSKDSAFFKDSTGDHNRQSSLRAIVPSTCH